MGAGVQGGVGVQWHGVGVGDQSRVFEALRVVS